MKNLRIVLFGLLLLGMHYFANAQTTQGRLIIGGETNLNFNSKETEFKSDGNSEDLGTITRFGLSPKVGYFIADGFAIGVEVPIETITYPDQGFSSDLYLKKEKSFAVTPFLRGYLGKNNIKPFLEFKAGFGKKTQDIKGPWEDLEWEFSTFQYEFSGGIAVFLNKYVAFEFGLGYSELTSKIEESNVNFETTDSNIDMGVGLLIVL